MHGIAIHMHAVCNLIKLGPGYKLHVALYDTSCANTRHARMFKVHAYSWIFITLLYTLLATCNCQYRRLCDI